MPVDDDECKNVMGSRARAGMMCAGGIEGADSCQGDGGGPLVASGDDGDTWLGSCPGAGGAPPRASTGSTPGSPTTWTGSTRRPTTCTMGELGGSHGHCYLIGPSVSCMLIYICNNNKLKSLKVAK